MPLESFELDHRRVRAPYLRVAASAPDLTKYDLRLCQPNQEALPTAPLHTLEHLLAGLLRERLPVWDLSPMGCRTGFYLSVLAEPAPQEVLEAFRWSLTQVLEAGEIPGASPLSCGNAADHDLAAAQRWAAKVLERGLRVQETVRLDSLA